MKERHFANIHDIQGQLEQDKQEQTPRLPVPELV